MKSITSFSRLVAMAAVVVGTSVAGSALAAAPQTVTYQGTPVTTAVPGKAVTLKFRVKNTSNDTYSGVKVTFHMPSDVNVSAVQPGNSTVDGNDISWQDVPLVPGQSFYPVFTATLDSGTPINSKMNIWVQIDGKDMQETSTNFSITAKKTTTVTPSTLSSTDVSNLFKSVYGRAPSASELKYWLSRRADKPGKTALWGAIAFAKANNIKH
jgi:hypothetical protein